MKQIFQRPKYLKNAVFHYCPGCGHSIIHRLVAEVIEELDIAEKTVGVPPAGCAVLAYDYFDIDMCEAPHGRGAALATGVKRTLPDRVVFSYQGDGDIAAIGTAETIHAANRGENITIIFVNNSCYGMTGGQMAPTTLLGQNSSTTPGGRDEKLEIISQTTVEYGTEQHWAHPVIQNGILYVRHGNAMVAYKVK